MPLVFLEKRMESEWPLCHPALLELFDDFNIYSRHKGLPDPTITQLVRYREEQGQLYFKYWKGLLALLKEKGPKALGLAERAVAVELQHKTDAELLDLALKRFTWHLVRCAVDMRTVGPDPSKPHYTAQQMNLVVDFFRDRCPRPLWELFIHDIHGPHLHVARRDFSWRQKYAAVSTANGAPDA